MSEPIIIGSAGEEIDLTQLDARVTKLITERFKNNLPQRGKQDGSSLRPVRIGHVDLRQLQACVDRLVETKPPEPIIIGWPGEEIDLRQLEAQVTKLEA